MIVLAESFKSVVLSLCGEKIAQKVWIISRKNCIITVASDESIYLQEIMLRKIDILEQINQIGQIKYIDLRYKIMEGSHRGLVQRS